MAEFSKIKNVGKWEWWGAKKGHHFAEDND